MSGAFFAIYSVIQQQQGKYIQVSLRLELKLSPLLLSSLESLSESDVLVCEVKNQEFSQ
ncbi:hypothetical protein HanRHA438_Chr05g0228151 [Helianthus annuus]|nr:hypothetical protein HanRHA438_Chr05g0228151 [Helianthus annuus]